MSAKTGLSGKSLRELNLLKCFCLKMEAKFLMEGAVYIFLYWNGSLYSANKRDSCLKITLAPALWATRGNQIREEKSRHSVDIWLCPRQEDLRVELFSSRVWGWPGSDNTLREGYPENFL